ncbi:MAG: HPr family phosphocarrier protein [Oscillospiraceae bacterium]
MKMFSYTIKDELGIHARPAGLLVKFVSGFNSDVNIKVGDKTANAKKLFAVMGLSAKVGDTITISVSGDDEEDVAERIQKFCEENF